MLCHKTYHSYHIVFLLYIAQWMNTWNLIGINRIISMSTIANHRISASTITRHQQKNVEQFHNMFSELPNQQQHTHMTHANPSHITKKNELSKKHTHRYLCFKTQWNLRQHRQNASKGRNPQTKANKITPQLHTSTMGGKYLKVGEGNGFFLNLKRALVTSNQKLLHWFMTVYLQHLIHGFFSVFLFMLIYKGLVRVLNYL